jgi:hypothetical protein
MRRELFSLQLPNPDRVEADYAVLAGLSKGLSGGDILAANFGPLSPHRKSSFTSSIWPATGNKTIRSAVRFKIIAPMLIQAISQERSPL